MDVVRRIFHPRNSWNFWHQSIVDVSALVDCRSCPIFWLRPEPYFADKIACLSAFLGGAGESASLLISYDFRGQIPLSILAGQNTISLIAPFWQGPRANVAMAAPGAMGTLLGSNGQSTEFDIQAW